MANEKSKFDSLEELEQAILNPKYPELPAVSDANKIIYWEQLPELILAWQQRVLKIGVNSDNPIVIYGHKEIEYVIAILGCFLAKIPYIPVDVAFPQERINKIISIANASVVYDAEQDSVINNEQFDNNKKLKEQDLAYIMFTSGSTGEPKGVQIGRESVLGLINWMNGCFNLSINPVFMNQAALSFDLSCYELYGFMSSNAHLLLNSKHEISNSTEWYNKLKNNKVNTWVSTPSFAYNQILNPNFNQEFLSDLKTFIFCGEPLGVNLAKNLLKRFPSTNIINSYGPTEATVATTYISIDKDILDTHKEMLPIGVPMPNSKVSVDKNGELIIVGNNVMRGYLNREDLNQEKLFIDCDTDFRGFKTGDAGYREDGLLFCKGRLDSQIKLHGYRIELDEIEKHLNAITGLHQGVVIPLKKRDGGIIRLVAFYTSNNDNLNTEVIIKKLSSIMPEYMIPSEFVRLEEFPHSVNNKIDKNKILQDYLS